MGVINIAKTIKKIHIKDIVLIKIGSFYYAYGRDSYILSFLFSYRLNKIEDVYSCAFPTKSLKKNLAILEAKKINYIIIDRRNNYEVDEKFDNKNLNRYDEMFERAKKFITLKQRIDNINRYLIDNINKENIKKIINKMEEIINEGRKI